MAELARADSIRAEMAERRPARDHGTDAVDVLTVPLRIVAFPFDVLFVRVPSFVIGRVTLPRAPGFVTRTLRDVGEFGVHPEFYTSIGPRSGPALSLRFDRFSPVEAEAAYSFAGSQRYRVGATWSERDEYDLNLGVVWRTDGEVGFYGIGPDTPDREIPYSRELFLSGATGWKRFGRVVLEGDLGYEDNSIGAPSADDDDPGTFGSGQLFGADDRLKYIRVGGGAVLDVTNRIPFQQRGFRLIAKGTTWYGVDGPPSDFYRLRFEAHGLVPLNERQLLALKARTEFTRAMSGEIPFYHLSQLGGEETAIAYPDNRFSDRDMLALTAEWRYEIWRDIHNTRRVEAFLYFGEGAVEHRLGDVDAADFHESYGFGLRIERPDDLAGLGYLGFGPEGVRVNISGEWWP